MRQSIRGRLSLAIMAVVLLVILLFGVFSNLYIREEFKSYVKRQQEKKTESILESIKHSYKALQDQWDENELHAIGMSALYEGFIIKVYDRTGTIVWDAESHDMSLCNQIRYDISTRMQNEQGGDKGAFETNTYAVHSNEGDIGHVSISFYGPYFYSQNDFSFLHTLTKIVLLVGGVALVFAIVIAYVLAKNISKPILKAVNVADQIANGKYDVMNPEYTSIVELDELSSSIHKMARSITEQEALRKQLTSDVAHELRTPLTAVSTHLEAMLEGIWEPNKKHLESCYEEVNRIIYIVRDLEQLEKLDRDRYTLRYSSFSMYSLLEKVIDNYAYAIKEQGLVLTLEGEECIVAADEERIAQVIINLISNAVKYTKQGDKITLRVEEGNTFVKVTVADTGIGIDKEKLPYIFERFYRADKSRTRKTGGAGIGLAIVKSIVEAHKGRIMVESEKGKGTSFVVELPKNI